MDRIWLRHYPPGVPADIDPIALRLAGGDVRGELRRLCGARRLCLYGQGADLCRARRRLARLRRLPAGARHRTRRARRRDDAERAAIRGCDRRHLARRLHRGEHQSALQAARARIPAHGCRRRGDRRAGELRLGAAGGAAADAGEARRRRQPRRHARPHQGRDRQRRRAACEEDGAALRHPGRREIQRCARRRPPRLVHAGRCRRRRHRLPAIHRRHDRRGEGRDAAASQPHRQRAADRRLAGAGDRRAAEGRAHGDRHRAAALSHLRVDRVPAVRRQQRRDVHPHSQSARYSRADQGTRQVQGELVPGGEHAVQRAAASSRLQDARLERAQMRRRRRHGGAEERSPKRG